MRSLEAAQERALAEDAELFGVSVEGVYRQHGEFVWACLQRFGVRDRDLDDVLQEVFVIVHQRLAEFRGDAQITTWLYAICLRVASAHRKRGYAVRETQVADLHDTAADEQNSPEDELVLVQRRRVLDRILDELDLEKRALLVMFEIDELPCEEIASVLGVPLGTVYSRLHTARKAFEKAVKRYQRRSAGARP